MKFSEIPYERPEEEAVLSELEQLAEAFRQSTDIQTQRSLIETLQKKTSHWQTMATVASIRNTVDTRDAFYEQEQEFWDRLQPVMEDKMTDLQRAILRSPFRKELEETFGPVWFLNMELQEKASSPELIPLRQEENALCTQYQKLYAGAQIPVAGQTATVPQMPLYKQAADRSLRKEAFTAEGNFFDAHREEFDHIFDELVKNRTQQARKLGFSNYVELGYLLNRRNCYGPKEVANFRRQVAEDLVPLVVEIKKAQAKRIGVSDFKFYDDLYLFADGNAKPQGTPEDILAAGRRMYTEMSPETKAFIQMMFDRELFDVLSKEGKAPGGYCTFLGDYGCPFIFSNFNTTSDDVDVLTHEAGHAFAFYEASKDMVLSDLLIPTMDAAEVQSMSMEFLTAPWHSLFFGEQTKKYELSHAEDALTFIPYGCQVDHFQQIVYENPDMTPEERNREWLRLDRIYRPYIDYDNLPFYARGAGWQWKMHIYTSPFYYIDYCMAQTIALQIWEKSMDNWQEAWQTYLRFIRQGGKKTFVGLVQEAGLKSPLEDGSLKQVCRRATDWLSHQIP